jgi:hypothetical protein
MSVQVHGVFSAINNKMLRVINPSHFPFFDSSKTAFFLAHLDL